MLTISHTTAASLKNLRDLKSNSSISDVVETFVRQMIEESQGLSFQINKRIPEVQAKPHYSELYKLNRGGYSFSVGLTKPTKSDTGTFKDVNVEVCLARSKKGEELSRRAINAINESGFAFGLYDHSKGCISETLVSFDVTSDKKAAYADIEFKDCNGVAGPDLKQLIPQSYPEHKVGDHSYSLFVYKDSKLMV